MYKPGEHPDHVVVIKYVPAVGDSKRALDEYYNEIFMGGRNTIALHNTCEDSLLASPLIIDLAISAELMSRITYTPGQVHIFLFHFFLKFFVIIFFLNFFMNPFFFKEIELVPRVLVIEGCGVLFIVLVYPFA